MVLCIHHVYKAVLSSYIREELLVQFEVNNNCSYIMKNGMIISHVP